MSKRSDTGHEMVRQIWILVWMFWKKGETVEGNFEQFNIFVLQKVELIRPASFIKGALEKIAVLKE